MTKEIIDAIASGDNLDAETQFKNAISSKVGAALEKKREEVANYYSDSLDDLSEIVVPKAYDDVKHVWHLYVIQNKSRDLLANFLKKNNVETAINYPICLPLLPAYSRFNFCKDDFPIASNHQSNILSLPIFPEITKEQVDHVCKLIKDFSYNQT